MSGLKLIRAENLAILEWIEIHVKQLRALEYHWWNLNGECRPALSCKFQMASRRTVALQWMITKETFPATMKLPYLRVLTLVELFVNRDALGSFEKGFS
ncbi:unnamed protein product [Urochloa humidicola]